MAQDTLILKQNTAEDQRYPLTFRGLTIGSGSTNDVIIKGEGVSQQHLRITYDGLNYNILPQPKSLPAFLDDKQLIPSVERRWEPGQVLHVGDHRLHLEREQEAQESVETYTEGPRIGQAKTADPALGNSPAHVASSTPDPALSDLPWPWIALVVAVVLVILGIIIF